MGCDIHAYIEVKRERILDDIPERFRTSSVVGLLRSVAESRDFSCLPIVSDALQDAGCEVESILAPFRGGTWRPPGQWVLHEWEKAYHTGEFYDDEKTVPQKDYTRLFLDPLHIGRDYDLYAI